MIDLDRVIKFLTIVIAIILFTFLLDPLLTAGFLMLTVLIGATFWFIKRKNITGNLLYIALFITIVVHLSAVLFIYYGNFQPFGGGEGDYATYNSQAQELAKNFRLGDFSGLDTKYLTDYGTSYYPVVIGLVYAIVSPQMIIGQIFSVWLAVVSIILIYLLVLEVGGTSRQAFLATILANLYPSYIFYGSLLLKDTIVVPLVFACLLLGVKLINKFSWKGFLFFYLLSIVLSHFRFYISYAVLISFVFCWLIFSNFEIKKRFWCAFAMIILFGFIPQICGNGYMGSNALRSYLSPEAIINYRQAAYLPRDANLTENNLNIRSEKEINPVKGTGSTIGAKTDLDKPLLFLKNYSETLMYSLFGPLPWQIKLKRQALALFETIPWYFLFIFVIKGVVAVIKKYKNALFMVAFSFVVFIVLGLFVPNFGIITRIRIPAFLSLFCIAAIGINFEGKLVNKIKNSISLVVLVAEKIKNWPIYFLDQKKLIKSKYIIFRLFGGKKIKARAGTIDGVVVYENFVCNVYTPKGFEIKKGGTVFDIGAHIGTFSVFASNFASKVYCFEPTESNFSLLKENLKINDILNVYPQNIAVSDRNGTKDLFINQNNTGGHSFYVNKIDSNKVVVPTVSLENFIDYNDISMIDFLKIDCEGGEYDIIMNCPRRVLDIIGKISMECHDIDDTRNTNALKKFLEFNGFIVEIKPNSCDGSPYFFAKNKKYNG